MKYILDASAIINLTEKAGEAVIDLFKECLTADLAYYEIGNFLWKVKRTNLVTDFQNVMKFLKIESIGLNENVLLIAEKENITYYDASYLFLSRKYGVPLISDDKDLVRRGSKKTSDVL